jgi:hypothetical protein
MFGWTLLDAVLGGDAVELLGGLDPALPPEEDEPEIELVLPDYAEGRQAHRRIYGVAG